MSHLSCGAADAVQHHLPSRLGMRQAEGDCLNPGACAAQAFQGVRRNHAFALCDALVKPKK